MMTVLRKNNGRGRRYVIVHAGCMEGWIGEPRIWEANSSSKVPDYHDNMNATIFEDYMDKLCRHCQDKGYEKVVFCMDNAKYHRREALDSDCDEKKRKTLSQLNKSELIERLLKVNPVLVPAELKTWNKAKLYSEAKLPKSQVPLAVEKITERYNLFSLSTRLFTFIEFDFLTY